MLRSQSRLCCVLILAVVAESGGREPTQLEQFYLELINRSRANPGGEVVRLSGLTWGDDGSPAAADLNEGLDPGTIGDSARPPLAFDSRLIDSASDYSDFLLATQQFSHGASGTPTSRMTAAGYVFTPSWTSGENLAITASTGPHPVDEARVEEHHAGLFIDGDVPGRGHRLNLLHPGYREVGIAIRADSNTLSLFDGPFHDVLSTQNFASSAGRIFVTGVIYHDLDSNSFYGPGESAGILALEVRNSGGTTVASGQSFGSGGFSINLHGRPAGTYTLVARDALGGEASAPFSWNGSVNVKVDLADPPFTAPTVLGQTRRPDARIGLVPSAPTGNDTYSGSATSQSLTRVSRRPVPVAWFALVENDGSESDLVRTTGTRGNALVRISYQRRQGAAYTNQTASILAGRPEWLQPGQSATYRIHLKLERRALGRRTRHGFHLRAVSNTEASRVDRVNGLLLNRTTRPRRR